MCDLPSDGEDRPFHGDLSVDSFRAPRPMTVSMPHPDYYRGNCDSYRGYATSGIPYGRQNGTEHFSGQFLLHEQTRWHVPMTVCQHRKQLATSSGEERYIPHSCAMAGQHLQLLTKTGQYSGIEYQRDVFKK